MDLIKSTVEQRVRGEQAPRLKSAAVAVMAGAAAAVLVYRLLRPATEDNDEGGQDDE